MHYIVFEGAMKQVHCLPCCLSQARSWMKPMNGAMPVPGPIMMTGLLALKGSRNWDLRMYMGTVALCPLSVGTLALSQLVATPLLMRLVFVLYSTTTAQMWMLLGWTCHKRALFSNTYNTAYAKGNRGCREAPWRRTQWSNNEPADGAEAHTGDRRVAAGKASLPGWPKCSDMHPRPSSDTATNQEEKKSVSITIKRRQKEYTNNLCLILKKNEVERALSARLLITGHS